MNSENPVPENKAAPDARRESNELPSHSELEGPLTSARSQSPTHAHCQTTCKTEKDWWDKIKPVLEIAGIGLLAVYTAYTIRMYRANKQSADAATQAADTAHDTLVLSERPWVKIKHRIVKPLTFNTPAWKGPVASMVIEDTLENVGPTIALNVISWEDVIPIDADHSLRAAHARQDQWCDANRHPDPKNLSGYILFSKDHLVQYSTVGPPMEVVTKAAEANSGGLRGKVGFVLVGCVCYRSSFEPIANPLHETKFIYHLGKPEEGGGIQPFVQPSGVANELRLVEFPDGFSAD